jgi:putative ABC transport system permease protein
MQLLGGVPRALTQGIRWLGRRPLTALTSTLCLAIGISAWAVAWTLLDAAILRPFGLPASHRLVVVWEANPSRNQDLWEVSHLNFLDWQRSSRTLESMAAIGSSHWPALARIGDETIPLASRAVSQSFFSTLGISPAVGRDFAPADLVNGSVRPVVLSHRFWQSRWGAAASVVGQSLFIDGQDHRVIGVMPRGFGYPDDPDVWISVERALADAFAETPLDQQRMIGVLEVLGRRRAEASNAAVRNELTGIVRALRARYHEPDEQVVAVVTPYADVLLGRLGTRLWIALALAAAVLLFACANVGAIRLAYAREREAETMARLFLGASRSRLGVDLSAETIPLIAAGLLVAAAGWVAIIAMLAGVDAVATSGLSLAEHRITAAIALLVAGVVAWIVAGVVPSWVACRRDLSTVRHLSSRVAARASSIGVPLVFGQAAVAIVVLAVAGAALQTFDRLSRTDVGFLTRGVTLIDVSLPGWKYQTVADRRTLMDELRRGLRQVSGVEEVAAVSVRPFRFGAIVDGMSVRRTGGALAQPDEATAGSRVVTTPEYFDALGQSITEGRGFTAFDRADTAAVAVISRTLARALFGNTPALGRQIDTYSLSEKWKARTIVGIAADAKYRGLERPSMEVYLPSTQSGGELSSFVVATAGAAVVSDAQVRQALRRVEPEIAIERIQTTGELMHSVLSPARLLAMLMSLLAGAGLLLLTLGIFGAAATALRAAWQEIAVRQAIGAMPFQAVRAPLRLLGRGLVLGTGLGLAVAPVALTAAEVLGLRATGGIATLLLAGVAAIIGAAMLATAPPFVKATRTSPSDLLRDQ